MRSDYVLYIVGVICFIIAGVFMADVAGIIGAEVISIEESMKQMMPIIFFMLGIIFAVGGYTLRPRAVFPTITVSAPPEPEPIPPVEEKIEVPATPPVKETPPVVKEAPVAEPIPPSVEKAAPPIAQTVEEPAKVEKTKSRKKPTKRRRRRKKKTET